MAILLPQGLTGSFEAHYNTAMTFKDETRVVTLGREEDFGFPSVNPPVFRTSTVIFPDLESFDAAEKGTWKFPSYGRFGNPTKDSFARAISALQDAEYTVLTTSGLAAITTSIMAFAGSGDHVLMTDNVYGPTRRFCDQELKRFGIETEYYDPCIGGDIEKLIRPNTKVLFMESPGSATFEMQDIEPMCKAAHAKGVVTIGDNTWATLLYFKPFEWGIDISIHSCTKYIAGHSDLIMGAISAQKGHIDTIVRAWKNFSTCSNSDDAYQAARGLRTMAVRLKHHEAAGLEIARWLEKHPAVERVLHPALPSDPGHALWKKYMTGACGLFGVVIKDPGHDKLAKFLDTMELFHMGFSWGGYESLIVPFRPAQIRTATQSKWKKDDVILRLNIGLEDTGDLIKDLDAAFKRAF